VEVEDEEEDNVNDEDVAVDTVNEIDGLPDDAAVTATLVDDIRLPDATTTVTAYAYVAFKRLPSRITDEAPFDPAKAEEQSWPNILVGEVIAHCHVYDSVVEAEFSS
jgi:hypothetical protein